MIDPKLVVEQPEFVKKMLRSRQREDLFPILDELSELEPKRKELIAKRDEARAQHKQASAAVSQDLKNEKLLQVSAVKKEEVAGHERELEPLESKRQELLLRLPNLLSEDVPAGKSEKDNKVLREWGEKPKFEFASKEYLALMEPAFIDVGRAAKVSGSRFGYIRGKLARLEFALVQFAFDELSKEGFIPVVPPVLIKREMMEAMGYLTDEKDAAERYSFDKDGLMLVGTSEQSVGPMHAQETFEAERLPLRYVAFSSCFRREAGSYGKDTKGILRVHQFDKVEMFSFSSPEASRDEHAFLLAKEEWFMQQLDLPYRVVHLCAADTAVPSASTYDIEAWFAGEGVYRETHSTSNTTDYQARRLGIKYRSKKGEGGFVHMLNGTVFAVGRMLVAIIERYQRADGAITVPKILVPYVGFELID